MHARTATGSATVAHIFRPQLLAVFSEERRKYTRALASMPVETPVDSSTAGEASVAT